MIKIALVKDAELWNQMESSSPISNEGFIERCVKLKMDIVENDPNEEKERKILNFGHTIGHAIESIALSRQEDILHGEAVAFIFGIFYAIKLSEDKLSFPKHKANLIYNYLTQYYNIFDLKQYKDLILNYLAADKKNINNEFCFLFC